MKQRICFQECIICKERPAEMECSVKMHYFICPVCYVYKMDVAQKAWEKMEKRDVKRD